MVKLSYRNVCLKNYLIFSEKNIPFGPVKARLSFNQFYEQVDTLTGNHVQFSMYVRGNRGREGCISGFGVRSFGRVQAKIPSY